MAMQHAPVPTTIDILTGQPRGMTYAQFDFLHLSSIEVYADWDYSPETGSVCYPSFRAATIYRFGRAYRLTGERLRKHVEKFDLAADLVWRATDALRTAPEAA